MLLHTLLTSLCTCTSLYKSSYYKFDTGPRFRPNAAALSAIGELPLLTLSTSDRLLYTGCCREHLFLGALSRPACHLPLLLLSRSGLEITTVTQHIFSQYTPSRSQADGYGRHIISCTPSYWQYILTMKPSDTSH